MNRIHKRTRRGRGGGGSSTTLEKFSKKPTALGKNFALSRANMLVNNGLCVGRPPSLGFSSRTLMIEFQWIPGRLKNVLTFLLSINYEQWNIGKLGFTAMVAKWLKRA